MFEIRTFLPRDSHAAIEVWRQCGLLRPSNDPVKDIARKAEVGSDLFLVGELDGEIVATLMGGYEGHRGWINYLGVLPRHRRQGFARQLVAELERRLRRVGCPKINLQVRSSNREVVEFYQRIGYSEDPVLSFGKRVEPD